VCPLKSEEQGDFYAWRVLRHFIGGNIHVREYKQTRAPVFVVWIRAPQFKLKDKCTKLEAVSDGRDKCPMQNKRTASMRIRTVVRPIFRIWYVKLHVRMHGPKRSIGCMILQLRPAYSTVVCTYQVSRRMRDTPRRIYMVQNSRAYIG